MPGAWLEGDSRALREAARTTSVVYHKMRGVEWVCSNSQVWFISLEAKN